MCGTEYPDGGVIERKARISWPISSPTFMQAARTPAQNIRFISRLYEVKDDGFARRIAEMVEVQEHLNVPLNKCPPFVKTRLALGLGIGLDFDIYLFDGAFAPVDKPFKEQAAKIVAGRMEGRGYVLASSVPAEVEQNCDFGLCFGGRTG